MESQQLTLRDREKPWRDEDLMRELYLEKQISMNKMKDKLDCSLSTVRNWIERHDIPKRTRSEACKIRFGHPNEVNLYTQKDGYETWCHAGNIVRVHRLAAVAEYGYDAVTGNSVHHRNEIPWDNRPDNFDVLRRGDHSSHHHTKVSGLDRVRIAELYENGDCSYRQLKEQIDHDVCTSTVRTIHKEFYGDEA